MRSKVSRLTLAALAVALVALAQTATASAATLTLGTGCVLSSADVPFAAAGLAPNTFYTVTANGLTVGSGTTTAAGVAGGTFHSPSASKEEATTIAVSDGTTTATASVQLTPHDALVNPLSGKPNRRVKIHLYGWFGRTVYIHFIAPHKKGASRTVKLSKTHGPCGHAIVKLRHWYSTASPTRGTWHIVFDTKKSYKKNRAGAITYVSTIS